jgi:type VI secretion system protein ImpK
MGDSRLSTSYSEAEPAAMPGQHSNVAPATAELDSSQRDKSNPFLMASIPLLTLMTQVKNSSSAPDVKKLHAQITQEVKWFVTKLKQLEFSPLSIDCATYCLCAALDEAILATEWGTQSIWVQASLLSIFKGETWGGERFYIIADTLSREPRKNIYVLELIYILLSLGFEGKYFGAARMMRDEVRNKLFQLIRSSRGKIERRLSLRWQDKKASQVQQYKQKLLKRMVISSISLILCLGVYYNIAAYESVKEVANKLKSISQESPITAYSLLLGRPIFPSKYE